MIVVWKGERGSGWGGKKDGKKGSEADPMVLTQLARDKNPLGESYIEIL